MSTLALRWRGDLVVRRQRWGARRCHVVKDPLSLRHFVLQDEEYWLASQLDGHSTIEAIRARFEREFAPRRMSVEHFEAFVARLHRDGLVVADGAGQGRVWLERGRQLRRAKFWQTWGNLLALRFRGVDPQRFLEAIEPWCEWCFRPAVVVAGWLLILAAGGLLLANWELARARLPDFDSFFGARNWWWLAIALAGTKVLHELGHALTCRRHGGECRELGLMFLVFTPCLYCDVSDAWLTPGKWRRAAISAAGIYVELVIAAIATLIWWFGAAGWLEHLCLSLIFVCGLGTLVFNANPLLRYDGYFVLSDLVERPNLWQQSRAWLFDIAARGLLGVKPTLSSPWGAKFDLWLAVYSIASFAYRWSVTVSMLWFVYRILSAQQLEAIGGLVVMTTLVGIAAGPVRQAWQWQADPRRRRQVRKSRVAVSLCVATLLAAFAYFAPLPCHVSAPLVLEADDADALYVQTPGRIVEQASAGSTLATGDIVLRLTNPDLEREVERLAGEAAVLEARWAQYEARRVDDPKVAALIPALRETREQTQQLLEERREDLRRLTIRATRGGVLMPPSRHGGGELTGELPSWQGSPYDPRNLGAHVESGQLLGWLGDSRRFSAVLFVDTRDVPLLAVGQTVRLRIASWPGRGLEGRVTEIARRDARVVPRELQNAEGLQHRKDEQGVARPVEATYEVRVELGSVDVELLNRMRGEAKIDAAPQTIVERLRRLIDEAKRKS